MKNYYVNTNRQSDGTHEVHTDGCSHPPLYAHRKDLGKFSSCKEALKKAKESYDKVDGCGYCCPECNKG